MSRSLRAALASTVVVLPVFWSVGQLRAWRSPPLDAVVFAVMIAVGLPRAVDSLGARDFPTAGAALLAGAAAAVGCGMLLDGASWQKAAGAVLFAIGVALPVWLRRRGPAWRAGGTVAAIPFLAVLVHPLPDQASWAFLGWMLLAASIACAWTAAIHLLTAPGPAPAQPAQPPAPARPASSRRVPASTRMAVQLALAVGPPVSPGSASARSSPPRPPWRPQPRPAPPRAPRLASSPPPTANSAC